MRTLRIGAVLTVTLSLLAACGGGGGGSQGAFCDILKKANADKSLNGTAGDTKARTAKIEKIFNDLADNAPSDIRGDVNVYKDAYPKIVSNDASFAQDKKAAAKVQTASTHVRSYSKDKCKVDLNSG